MRDWWPVAAMLALLAAVVIDSLQPPSPTWLLVAQVAHPGKGHMTVIEKFETRLQCDRAAFAISSFESNAFPFETMVRTKCVPLPY